tara:strand:+ start:584 stop:907 length:324 start_codon:yes stop_codon:yes gene_type:complete
MQDQMIETDEMAISLTKPAMKLGVPFVPFYTNLMACFMGWMVYQSMTGVTDIINALIFLFIWFVVYATMYLITSKDTFGLTIFWVNLTKFTKQPNLQFWGNTESYLP